MLKYFARFGTVELLKLYENEASEDSLSHFAFVVFSKSTEARKALKCGSKHRLQDGTLVDVVPACLWSPEPIYCDFNMATDIAEVVGDDLQVIKMPESYKVDHLSALNDDCLREIFKYLSVFDLFLIRTLKKRYVSIVDNVLDKEFNKPYAYQLCHKRALYFNLIAHSKSKLDERISLQEVDYMLRSVGNYVNKIQISSTVLRSTENGESYSGVLKLELIMDKILKYCTENRLYHLSIMSFQVYSKMGCYARIWENLHTLELMNYDMYETELEAIFKNCKQLESLKLDLLGLPNTINYGTELVNCNKITGACLLYLPKTLIELCLRNCKGLELRMLDIFFQHNGQLKKFQYSSRHFSRVGLKLYSIVSKHLINLKEFHIDNLGDRTELMSPVAENVQSLISVANLKNLKKLTIDVKNHSISQMLIQIAQNEQLEELFLKNVQINPYPFDGASTQFPSLKILKIHFKDIYELNSLFFENLAKFLRFHNLQEFQIDNPRHDLPPRRIKMGTLWNGLRLFIVHAKNMSKLYLRVPSIIIDMVDYHNMLFMAELRIPARRFFVHLSRQNLTPGLSNFLDRKTVAHALVFRYPYFDFEYPYDVPNNRSNNN